MLKKLGIPEGYEFVIALGVGKALESKDAHELHPEKITIIR